jgi:tetratricopeptide (TPR) repeat protein
MIDHKLGVFALLLEINAWSGPLFFASGSDILLLWYLGGHALASLLLGFFAWNLLPAQSARPRLPVILLFSGFCYAIPVAGFLGVLLAALALRSYRRPFVPEPFDSVPLPEYDPHQREPGLFRQAGLRAVLGNPRVPTSSRLGAMVALQYVPGRIASPLLRDVLTDPNEDIRLLAYGMLDNQEKRISRAIDEELKAFGDQHAGKAPLPPEKIASAHRLSDLYWELVYHELALGDLRQYAIDASMRYCLLVLERHPDHAPLTLRRGRLLHETGDLAGAEAAYRHALELGLPATRVLPYLAELKFQQRDFLETQRLMRELAHWNALPRLRPLIEYWSAA